MAKITKDIVIETILKLKGVNRIKDEGRNGHGPTITIVMDSGEEFTYGYDSSPKGSYSPEKTRKGIRHALLTKGAMRGIPQEKIYNWTEWR